MHAADNNKNHDGQNWKRVAAMALALLLSGCTVIGPTSITTGRQAYNDAIVRTGNEQMLLAIVRNRYLERGSMLSVSSVTANVKIATSAEVQAGFGDEDNYTGNLVPFTGGLVYEENPTISYTPVEGQQYLRQLMTPLSVQTVAGLVGGLADPGPVYGSLLESVNGLQNPGFLFSGVRTDPGFARFVEIMTELKQANRLHWVDDDDSESSIGIVIDHYAESHLAQVTELMDLLGLPAPANSGAPLELPVLLALDARATGGIGFSTRPVFALIEILSAAVAVPDADLQSGRATTVPPLGLVGQKLHIHYSTNKPDDSSVAVRYRGGWFYIDDTDLATKGLFRLMSTLWSVTIAESSDGSSSRPVLTVPVSR
ncbi:MAG: hypothetical protein WBN31_07575 [Gammaproteobacteria bacterium]